MKIDELKSLQRGTVLVYEHKPFQDGERVVFICKYTEELGRGGYAERAYVRFADGHEGYVPASKVRLPNNYDLSARMLEALRSGYDGKCIQGDGRSVNSLKLRGLVQDTQYGPCFTAEGIRIARLLFGRGV